MEVCATSWERVVRKKVFTDEMIIGAIKKAKTARGAARLIGCSPGYIHQFVSRPGNEKHRIWGTQGVDASR